MTQSWLTRGRSWAKPFVRDGIARGLSLTGVTSPSRFARSALTVVTFHRVLPEPLLRQYPLPGLAVTPEQMEQIVRELQREFRCLTLIDAYREHRKDLKQKRPLLAITLDDGALDNFKYARPVLEKLGLRGSFYIPVHSVQERLPPWHDALGFALMEAKRQLNVGKAVALAGVLEPFGVPLQSWINAPDSRAIQGLCEQAVEGAKTLTPERRSDAVQKLRAALGEPPIPDWAGVMSWEQVKELSDGGHEIGSHTLTHPLLPDCESEKIAQEIHESRVRLQEVVGRDVASFCYPNGSYDTRCIEQAEEAGYECSVTTRWGLNALGTPPHELFRCDMDFQRVEDRFGVFSVDRLMLRLSGWQPGLK